MASEIARTYPASGLRFPTVCVGGGARGAARLLIERDRSVWYASAVASRHRVERLRVAGWKSIADLTLELRALNVLVGANGAGKSNLLSLFRLLNAVTDGDMSTYVAKAGGASSLLHDGRKRTAAIDLQLDFASDAARNVYRIALIPVAGDALAFAEESVGYRKPPAEAGDVPLHSIGRGHRESQLTARMASGDKTAQTIKYNLDRFRHYHFHDTSPSAPVKQTGDVRHNRFLFSDAGNLAAYLRTIRDAHPARYAEIRATIRLALPQFDDFVLEPDPVSPTRIRLEWRQRGSRQSLFADSLSDGTLRFMALTTLLLQPPEPERDNVPRLIVIDEPELGLHPYALLLIAEMLESAARWTQLVIATQSVTLLDNLSDPESVIVTEHTDDGSRFERLARPEYDHWLETYSLGEAWLKNVIGGRPSAS